MSEDMIQLAIGVLSPIAIWLSQDERSDRSRYACLIGMVGQPFWLYGTWINEQWGMFLVSVVTTFAWWRGIRRYWLKKPDGFEKTNGLADEYGHGN